MFAFSLCLAGLVDHEAGADQPRHLLWSQNESSPAYWIPAQEEAEGAEERSGFEKWIRRQRTILQAAFLFSPGSVFKEEREGSCLCNWFSGGVAWDFPSVPSVNVRMCTPFCKKCQLPNWCDLSEAKYPRQAGAERTRYSQERTFNILSLTLMVEFITTKK